MKVTEEGFFVIFPGDHSVGIYSHEWMINGPFEFDSREDLIEFKKRILAAFEWCSDTPLYIESFSERRTLDQKDNFLVISTYENKNYYERMRNLIHFFSESFSKKKSKSHIANTVFESIIRGKSPYEMIEHLIEMQENAQNTIERLLLLVPGHINPLNPFPK